MKSIYVIYCKDKEEYLPMKDMHSEHIDGQVYVVRTIEEDKAIRRDLKELEGLVDQFTKDREIELRRGIE